MEEASSSSVGGSDPAMGDGGHNRGEEEEAAKGVLNMVDLTWTTYAYGSYGDSFPLDVDPQDLDRDNFSYPSVTPTYRNEVKYHLEQFVMPVIFGIGILGNVANLFLLTSRRLYPHRRQTTQMERSAVMGLKTLAASDLLFCLVGFPYSFAKRGREKAGAMTLFRFYFITHNVAFLNVFLFTSTWLIMLVSVERYIAVCHPFRAASLIRVRRTLVAHLLVFAGSALLNIPLFLRYSIVCKPCVNSTCCFVEKYHYITAGFENMHHIVWFTFGTFTPLVLILASNALLIRELYHKASSSVVQRGGSSGMGASVSSGSSRSRSINVTAESERTSTKRLTLTLLAVVFCFIILVCPSMLLEFIKFVDGQRSRAMSGGVVWIRGNEAFLWAVNITNLIQAIKFSSNFLLYCAINRTFRQMFARLVRGDSCRTQTEHLQHEQQQQRVQENGGGGGGGEMKPPCEVIQMIEK